MIVAIICIVVVLFVIILQIGTASVSTRSTHIGNNARAQIAHWLREKTTVIKHHEYVYRTGQINARDMIVQPRFAEVNKTTLLPNPIELQDYEVMTAPFFANDIDLLALYNVMSNNQTWKVQGTVARITTQLRYAGTVSATNTTPFFERYERQRGHTEELEDFKLAKHQLKRYLPTEQGWYQDASAAPYNATTETYEGLWQGPTFQGTGAGANDGYGLEPVMTYLQKVLWKDKTKFSVFKLKILTTQVSAMLQRLHIPGSGDIAIVNSAGDMAGFRLPDKQVIPYVYFPRDHTKEEFTKVWSVSHFANVVTPESLAVPIPSDSRMELGSGVSLFTVPTLPGFRIVIYLDREELIEEKSKTKGEVIVVVGAVLVAIAFLTAAALVFFVCKKRNNVLYVCKYDGL